MLTILKQREEKKKYAPRRIFRGDSECYGFRCDDDGNPVFRGKWEEILYYRCLEKPNKFKDCGKVWRTYTSVFPAIGLCECGREIKLTPIFGKGYAVCGCQRRYKADGTEILQED